MMNQLSLSPAASDADLVSLSLSGNRDAFGLIVDRYQALSAPSPTARRDASAAAKISRRKRSSPPGNNSSICANPAACAPGFAASPAILSTMRCAAISGIPRSGAESIDKIEEPAAAEPAPAQQAISSRGRIDPLAFARADPGFLSRTDGALLSRTSIGRARRRGHGVERGGDPAASLARSQTAARGGARVRRGRTWSAVRPARPSPSPCLPPCPGFALPASAAPVTVAAAIEGGIRRKIRRRRGIPENVRRSVCRHRQHILRPSHRHEPRPHAARARRVKRGMWKLLSGIALYVARLRALSAGWQLLEQHHVAAIAFGAVGSLVFTVWLVRALLRDDTRRVRAEERARHPELFAGEVTGPNGCREYRSRWSLFGLPLVHVYLGIPSPTRHRRSVGSPSATARSACCSPSASSRSVSSASASLRSASSQSA